MDREQLAAAESLALSPFYVCVTVWRKDEGPLERRVSTAARLGHERSREGGLRIQGCISEVARSKNGRFMD